MPRIKYTIEITVDANVTDTTDMLDSVLDNGALQDALTEYATDQGATLTVESCVVAHEMRLCDDEGPCVDFPKCSCSKPRGMTAYERQERSGDAY